MPGRLHVLWSMRCALLLVLIGGVSCVPSGGGSGGGGEGGRSGDDGGADDMARPDTAMCTPECGDRACGDDGCGTVCGACVDGAVCSVDGACVDVAVTCGDGACGDGEDCATCPADCGQCCGNGACEPSQAESCATCAADCACADGETCAVEARRCVELPPDAGPDPEPDAGPTGPPRILTLNTNRREMTDGDMLILSAVVTDPDGIGDVIGGVLESPGGASYGAFVTAGEEGAYSLTLTWGDLHAVESVDFDQGEAEARSLEAVFFDQGGDSVREAIEITLACGGDGACDGVCTDLTTALDCGQCGSDCGDDLPGIACVDGMCQCPPGSDLCAGRCVDLTAPTHCGACGNICAPGVECRGGQCICEGECRVPGPSDLAITEFMPDPAAVTDTNGEWFEVSNVSGRPLRLDGVALGNPDNFAADGPDTVRVFGIELAPGARLLFGKRDDVGINGGVDIDVAVATLSLRNSDDVIAIADAENRPIHTLFYALPAGSDAGASWQLDPATDPEAGAAAFPAGWCQSPAPWPGSAGDLGSPGAPNVACP